MSSLLNRSHVTAQKMMAETTCGGAAAKGGIDSSRRRLKREREGRGASKPPSVVITPENRFGPVTRPRAGSGRSVDERNLPTLCISTTLTDITFQHQSCHRRTLPSSCFRLVSRPNKPQEAAAPRRKPSTASRCSNGSERFAYRARPRWSRPRHCNARDDERRKRDTTNGGGGWGWDRKAVGFGERERRKQ